MLLQFRDNRGRVTECAGSHFPAPRPNLFGWIATIPRSNLMRPIERRNRAIARHVPIDDVTTMGGTLADLADHVRRYDGTVAGGVVIVKAARTGRLLADPRVTARLERRFGDVIRELFDIDPAALTAEEARYLDGFRSADEIRNRSIKARQTTLDRLRTRRVQGP